MIPRATASLTCIGACAAVILLAAALPLGGQSRRALSEDAVLQLVRAALQVYFDPTSAFEVSLSGINLAGDSLGLETLTIVGRPAVVRGLRADVIAHFAGLQVDVAELGNQLPQIGKVRKATIVARATARDVQESLAKMSANISRPTVRFSTKEFEVTATIRRGNRLYPVSMRGGFVIEQGRRVRAVISQAQVFGSDAPMGLVEAELARVNPILDLSGWPVNLRIQRLVLHNDRVELLATEGK